ncbi:alpha/beta hydrolase family protein [Agrobacterium vitis]|uniref:alpha/beta hydrolase family protein n=1 Tax=Agrobacterium vitis TaxID=373 RepID=UPI003D29E002
MRFSSVLRSAATFILLAAFLLFGNSIASAYQQRSVENGHGKPIKIAIWLPDTVNPGTTKIHPLVLISHGNGGGLAAHSDTAEALVSAGYIVVAIAHPGDTKGDDRDPPRKWLIERIGHVTRVLDYLQSEWEGRTTIDPSRIGAFGFSAGGFTMLVASGASPSAALAQEYCRKAPAEFACRLKLDAELSRLGGEDAGLYRWPHDDRIKAAVIAAPALGFSFDRHGLAKLQISIQLWAAEKDDRAPVSTNTAPLLERLPTSPEYHLVRGADHFAFSRPCEPGDENRRSCKGPAGFDRAAFHEQFNRKVVEFFNRALHVAPKQ